MAGNKNSGRRITSQEEKRRNVLQMAWDLTYAYFHNPKVPTLEKQKVATQLVVKDITLKQSIEGDALTKVIVAYANSAKCSDTNRISEVIAS